MSGVTHEVATLTAIRQAYIDLIDAGAAAGYVKVEDSGDNELAVLPLTDPCGTIDGAGLLTITFGARDEAATASGTPDHGKIYDSDDTLITTIDAAVGTTPVANTLVFSGDSVAGEPFEGSSFTVG